MDDLRASHLVAEIPVEGNPDWQTFLDGSVWIGTGSLSVVPIDAQDNAVAASVPVVSPCLSLGAAGGGSVWVTMPDTPVTRIDPSTNVVVAQYEGAGGDCIGWWADSLWPSNNREGTVWRLTP